MSSRPRGRRGGSWVNVDARLLRSSFRFGLGSEYRDVGLGFRCVRTVSAMQSASDSPRAYRGGSWFVGDARFLRSSYRLRVRPEFRGNYLGFRCVREDSRKPSKLARSIADELLRRLK